MNNAKRSGPGRGFWLGIGLVAIVGIAVLAWLTNRPKAPSAAVDPSLPALKAEGYLMGSPTAPVEITEFADFECPGCGQFATLTEPDVRARLVNTGKVRIRYIDYPLPMHKNTWDASLAAACASDQGKFWPMHDAIFANQDRWNGEATSRPRSVLSDLAKSIGLDANLYDDCMKSDRNRAKIQSHLAEAERRQVNQTPTFVIGGRMYTGALPFDELNRIVTEELARVPAAPAARATDSAAAAK